MFSVVQHLITALLAMAFFAPCADARVELPAHGLQPEHVALVINQNDPYSVKTGREYARLRAIPERNIIRVRFAVQVNMTPRAFRRVKAAVDAATPASVQAYALAWTQPFKVSCMSVTSAFAFGLDERYCAEGCQGTRQSAYFDSDTRRPFDDLGIRPAMSLAARDADEASAFFARTVRAHHSWPEGAAFLVETTDARRNVRALQYAAVAERLRGLVDVRIANEQQMRGVKDVLFYFTGTKRVQGLEDTGFVGGAIGDHLTSSGGRLTSDKQMSALRWLEAGTSGSYGTVIEPCNIVTKFPDPAVVIERYVRGETLLEAYWKSVAMPGQGVFIGDPLAAPFGGARVTRNNGIRTLESRELAEGEYTVLAAQRGERFAPLGNFTAKGDPVRRIALPNEAYDCYRVIDMDAGDAQDYSGGRCQ